MFVSKRKAAVAGVLIALTTLGGCAGIAPMAPRPSGPPAATSGPVSTAPTEAPPVSQPPADGGGDSSCSAWKGKPGVGQTYCDGPGTATLSVNGKEQSLKGGECQTLGSTMVFSLGVVTSELPAGTAKPDYLGIIVNTSKNQATVAFTTGGTSDALLSAAAELGAGAKTGTITGTGLSNQAKVKITYNCG